MSNKSVAGPRSRGTKLALPNPQGKGQIGFLLDWHYSAPRHVVAKPPEQLLADYFTSLLVLSADFKFRPVFGTEYFLYLEGARWSLSLLSPDDWNSDDKRAAFVGACVLHDDSTWSIAPSENLSHSAPIAEGLASFYAGFVERLDVDQSLESELPFYEGQLPYYQRLFAAALSRSLKLSVRYGDLGETPSRDWLAQLPQGVGRLIAPGDS